MAMLTPGGDLDTSFGPIGVLTTAEPWKALAADAGGGVVVTEEYSTSSLPWRSIVVRYGADGQLDTSFGDGGGKIFDAVPGWVDLPQDIDVGPGGRIAITGGGSGPDEPDWFTVVQLGQDGQLDTAFSESQNSVPGFSDVSGSPREAAFDPAGNVVASQASQQPPDVPGATREIGIRLLRLSGTSSGSDEGGDDDGGVAGDVAASGRGLRIHKFVSPRTLAGIVTRGMRALVSCELDCRAVLKVKVPKRIADDLGLSSRVIARGSRRIGADRKRWMVLKTVPSARPALRSHVGRISFKVRGRGLAP
jgi:hypothetical protein